jgi:hypothetical protein
MRIKICIEKLHDLGDENGICPEFFQIFLLRIHYSLKWRNLIVIQILAFSEPILRVFVT